MGCHASKKMNPASLNTNLRNINSVSKSELEIEMDSSIDIIDIQKEFKFSKKVAGQGTFGTVRVAWKTNAPNLLFALKSIPKEKVNKTLIILKREIDIIKSLDHPNIVKLYEFYQDQKSYHLLLEYCCGGELLERIIQIPKFSEPDAAALIRKMLYAVNYLHENSIIHRDLKPENFIFKEKSEDSELKLIDFGLAYNIEDARGLRTVVGSAFYIAPEVHSGKYSYPSDIWSIGIIAYLLVTGDLPFRGDNVLEIYENSISFNLNKSLEKETLTVEMKQFLNGLLQRDPSKRFTSKLALENNWITSKNKSENNKKFFRLESVCVSLKKYKTTQSFKREAMKIIISQLKKDEIQKLHDTFIKLDHDNTGKISIENFKKAMEQAQGLNSSIEEITQLIQELKLNSENEINYTEFICAVMNRELITEERIKAAFHFYDIDNSNFITLDNIKDAMSRSGRKVSEDEINLMLNECDLMKNGKISYEEFLKIMSDDKGNTFSLN